MPDSRSKGRAAYGRFLGDSRAPADILAEHFLGMVSSAPAWLASFGIVRDAADTGRHTRTAVELFLRSLRPG